MPNWNLPLLTKRHRESCAFAEPPELGSMSLWLLVAFSVLWLIAAGALGVSWRWKRVSENHLKAHQCVGLTAHRLKESLNQIEFLNSRIQELRLAASAVPEPAARVAIRASLKAIEIFQDKELLRLLGAVSFWNTIGCPSAPGIQKNPIQSPSWKRPPEDSIGTQALWWLSSRPKKIRLHANYRRQNAAALIQAKTMVHTNAWSADFISPGNVFH